MVLTQMLLAVIHVYYTYLCIFIIHVRIIYSLPVDFVGSSLGPKKTHIAMTTIMNIQVNTN